MGTGLNPEFKNTNNGGFLPPPTLFASLIPVDGLLRETKKWLSTILELPVSQSIKSRRNEASFLLPYQGRTLSVTYPPSCQAGREVG